MSVPSLSKKQSQIDFFRRVITETPRILLIRLRSLGDALLTLPLVEALHQWRPELEVDVLIEASYASVFSQHPAVHQVLILKTRRESGEIGWTRGRAFREIRKRRYPAVINLHGGTTSMLFTIASGAKVRLGEKNHRGSWIYNARIPPSTDIWRRSPLHTVEHQLAAVLWLGIPVPHEPAGSLHVNGEARERVRRRLARLGFSRYFLIQPTATLATKQWEPEKFARLGDWISERYGLPVIYTSAPHEAATLQKIREKASERHVYWSDLNLMDLFALIEGCRLFIGNDSGPTHAASALKKPVVVIWGSSDFHAWHPWATIYEAVRLDFPCAPCPGYTCAAFGRPRCILDITVEKVAEACERILERTQSNEDPRAEA